MFANTTGDPGWIYRSLEDDSTFYTTVVILVVVAAILVVVAVLRRTTSFGFIGPFLAGAVVTGAVMVIAAGNLGAAYASRMGAHDADEAEARAQYNESFADLWQATMLPIAGALIGLGLAASDRRAGSD